MQPVGDVSGKHCARDEMLFFVLSGVRVLSEILPRELGTPRRTLHTSSHFSLHIRDMDREHFFNEIPVNGSANTHCFVGVDAETSGPFVHLLQL